MYSYTHCFKVKGVLWASNLRIFDKYPRIFTWIVCICLPISVCLYVLRYLDVFYGREIAYREHCASSGDHVRATSGLAARITAIIVEVARCNSSNIPERLTHAPLWIRLLILIGDTANRPQRVYSLSERTLMHFACISYHTTWSICPVLNTITAHLNLIWRIFR